jgi:hypothetical protein
MRLSRYFLPLLKEDPKEAQIVSHVFLPTVFLIVGNDENPENNIVGVYFREMRHVRLLPG